MQEKVCLLENKVKDLEDGNSTLTEQHAKGADVTVHKLGHDVEVQVTDYQSKVDSCNQTILSMQTELADTKAILQKTTQTNQNLSKELTVSQEALIKEKLNVQCADEKSIKMEQESKHVKQEIKRLEERLLKSMQNDNEINSMIPTGQSTQNTQIDDEIIKFKAQLIEAKEDYETLLKNSEAIERYSVKLEKQQKNDRKRMNADIELEKQQKNDRKRMNAEIEKQQKNDRKRMNADIEHLQKRIDEVEKERDERDTELMEERERMQTQLEDLQRHLKKSQSQHNDVQRKLADELTIQGQKQDEITRLHASVDELKRELQAATARPVEGMLELKERMEGLLVGYKDQIDALNRKLGDSVSKDNYHKIEQQLTEVQTKGKEEIDRLLKEREGMKEGEGNVLQQYLEEIQKLKEAIHDMENEKKQLLFNEKKLVKKLEGFMLFENELEKARESIQDLRLRELENAEIIQKLNHKVEDLDRNWRLKEKELLKSDAMLERAHQDIEMLELKINQQLEEIGKLNIEIGTLERQGNDRRDEMQSEMEDLQQQIKDYQNQRHKEELQSQNKNNKEVQLNESVEELRIQHKTDEDRIRYLEDRIRYLHNALSKLTTEDDEISRDGNYIEITEEILSQAVDNQSSLTKMPISYKTDAEKRPQNTAGDEVTDLQLQIVQLERAETEYKQQMKQLETDYQKHVGDLENQLQNLEVQHTRLRSSAVSDGRRRSHQDVIEGNQLTDLRHLQQQITEQKLLNLKVSDLENSQVDLEERLELAQRHGKQTEIIITRDTVREETRRQEIQSLHERIRDLESAENSISQQVRDSQQEDLALLKQRIWELERSEKALKQDVEFHKTQKEEAVSLYSDSSMLDQPEDILRQKIIELEKMEQHLKQQIRDLESDREELHDIARKDKGLIHGLNVNVRELTLKEKNLHDHIGRFEMNENLQYNRIDDLEDLIQEYESKLKTSLQQGQQLSIQLEDLNMVQKTLKKKIELLEESIEILLASERDLKGNLQSLEEEKSSLKVDLKTASLRLGELEESELQLKQKVRTLESEQVVSQGRLIQLQCSANASAERVQHLEMCNDKLSKANYQLEEEKSSLQYELSEAKHQTEEEQNEKDKLQKSEQSLQQEISRLENLNRNLTNKITDAERDSTNKEKQIERMESSMSSSREKLKMMEKENTKLQGQIQELQAAVKIAEGKLSAAGDVSAANKALLLDLDQQQRRIRQLEETIDDYQHKMNVNRYSNLSGSVVQISRNELAELKAQVALVEQSERTVIRLERLEKHLKMAIDELRQGKDVCGHDGEIKDLKEELNIYQKKSQEHAILVKNHEDLKQRFSQLQDHIKILNEDKDLRRNLSPVLMRALRSPRPQETKLADIEEFLTQLPTEDVPLPPLSDNQSTDIDEISDDIQEELIEASKREASQNAPPLPKSPQPFLDHQDTSKTPIDGESMLQLNEETTPVMKTPKKMPPVVPPKPLTPLWLRHQHHQEIRQEEWLELEKTYKTQINTVTSQLHQTQQQSKAIQDVLDVLMQENEKLKSTAKLSRDSAKDRQLEVQGGLVRDMQDQIKKLKQDLTQKEIGLREKQRQLDRQKTTHEPESGSVLILKNKLEHSNSQREDMRIQVDQLSKDLSSKERQLVEMTNTVGELRKDLQMAKIQKSQTVDSVMSEPKVPEMSPHTATATAKESVQNEEERLKLQQQLSMLRLDLAEKKEEGISVRRRLTDEITNLQAKISWLLKKCHQKDALLKKLLVTIKRCTCDNNSHLISEVKTHLDSCHYKHIEGDFGDHLSSTEHSLKTPQSITQSLASSDQSYTPSNDSIDSNPTESLSPLPNNVRIAISPSTSPTAHRQYHHNVGHSDLHDPTFDLQDDSPSDQGETLFKAAKDYDPKQFSNSRHPRMELGLKAGDILHVLGPKDDRGYCEAEVNGQIGLVPMAYLQPVNPLTASSVPPRTRTIHIPGNHMNKSPEKICEMHNRLDKCQSNSNSSLVNGTLPSTVANSPVHTLHVPVLPNGNHLETRANDIPSMSLHLGENHNNQRSPVQLTNGHRHHHNGQTPSLGQQQSPNGHHVVNTAQLLAVMSLCEPADTQQPYIEADSSDTSNKSSLHRSPPIKNRVAKKSYPSKHVLPNAPRNFKVSKVMSNSSVILSWDPPNMDALERSNGHTLEGYKIFVDDNQKSTIQSPLITRVILDKVNLTKSTRFSIQTLTETGIPSNLVDTVHNGYIASPPTKKSSRTSLTNNKQQQLFMAIYDYDHRSQGPKTEDKQLDLKTGDVVLTFGPERSNGFYYAEVNGKQGLVPTYFLEKVPQE